MDGRGRLSKVCIEIVQGFGLIALTCVRLIKIRSEKIQLSYNG